MNINKIFLGGRLTRDIQLSYTSSSTAVAEFGMAVNKKYKEKETVLFVDLVCFGKQAETLNQYTSKGDPLFIEGELQLDTWTKDGKKHSKHKVLVTSFQFLPSGEKKQSEPEPSNNVQGPF